MAAYEDMTLPELLAEQKKHPTPGGSNTERIATMIQIRLAQQQDSSAQDLVAATAALVMSTSRLVRATWGLVIATFALVATEIILKSVFHR